MLAASAVPIALASLPPPVDDQAAGGLVDDEPGVRGGEQVPVRGGDHAESRRGCLVAAVVAVPFADRVGYVAGEGRGAGTVAGGADFPVPARVVVALTDGEVGEGPAVEGGHGPPAEVRDEPGALAGHGWDAPGQHRGQPQVGPLPGVALAELHFRPLRGAGRVEDGSQRVPVDVLLVPCL